MCEQVADNGNHASLAIQNRCTRGTVIKDETIVCVVSGGNIDASKLTKILAGTTP